MVADGIEPPNNIIPTECNPAKGLVVAAMKSCEHPYELLCAQTAIIQISHEILIVVPIDEAVHQSRKKRGEGANEDDDWNNPLVFDKPSHGGSIGLRSYACRSVFRRFSRHELKYRSETKCAS